MCRFTAHPLPSPVYMYRYPEGLVCGAGAGGWPAAADAPQPADGCSQAAHPLWLVFERIG